MAQCTIIGSANGIENLGDVLLLHCAMRNLNKARTDLNHFTIQVHGDLDKASALGKDWEPEQYRSSTAYDYDWSPGPLQSNWIRRRPRGLGRIPDALYYPVLMSLYLTFYLFGAWGRKEWLNEWKASEFVYFYGGSHFSSNFFWSNGFPMLLLAFIARRENVRLIFGPQQFGPQSMLQAKITSFIFRLIEYRVMFRNRACALALGLPEKLTYDEVFVSDLCDLIAAPPVLHGNPGLLNFRANDFDEILGVSKIEGFIEAFNRALSPLSDKWLIFAMSKPNFNNDAVLSSHFDTVTSQRDGSMTFDLLAKDLSNSSVCVAMSFHGCILSVMCGVNAIPIVSGGYYSWKFDDFDRYCGHDSKIIWRDGAGWVLEGLAPIMCGKSSDYLIENRKKAAAHHAELLKALIDH